MAVVRRVSWSSRRRSRRNARLLDEIVVHRRRKRRLGGIMAILGSDTNGFGVRGTTLAPVIVAPGNDEVILNAPAYTEVPSGDVFENGWWYGWDPNVPVSADQLLDAF